MTRLQNKDPHRCFVAPELLSKATLHNSFTLPVDVAHRVTNILRLKTGSLLELFDGSGKIVVGKIVNGYSIEVIEITQSPKSTASIILAQAMTKWSKLEEVVQRCTEIGVDEIVLFYCERSIISDEKDYSDKIDRLQRIAQDASRQSGRTHVPRIHYPLSFASLISMCTNFSGLKMVGTINCTSSLLNVVTHHQSHAQQDGVLVIIGPEGDLSPKEHAATLQAHALETNFGPYVLRTETAGLVALSIIIAALEI